MHIQRLTIENVRRFGDGVRGLDLELPPRGWIVLAGPNGSGKTTVLQCIARALFPELPDDVFRTMSGWIRRQADRATTRLELVATAQDDEWADEAQVFSKKDSTAHLVVGDSWEGAHGAISHGRQSDENRAFNGPWSKGARGWLTAGYGAQRRLIGHSGEATSWMESDARSAAATTLFRDDASLMMPVRALMDLHHQSLDPARTQDENAVHPAMAWVAG